MRNIDKLRKQYSDKADKGLIDVQMDVHGIAPTSGQDALEKIAGEVLAMDEAVSAGRFESIRFGDSKADAEEQRSSDGAGFAILENDGTLEESEFARLVAFRPFLADGNTSNAELLASIDRTIARIKAGDFEKVVLADDQP